MEECETLCNRIGIMVNGEMKCLGSVQHLKNKFVSRFKIQDSSSNGKIMSELIYRFGDGYTLTLKLSGSEAEATQKAAAFVESEFPGAILKEKHSGMLEYQLPTQGVKLPQIFAAVVEARNRLGLEDYALCQTTLDQVFISFASSQTNSESTKPTRRKNSVKSKDKDLPLDDQLVTVTPSIRSPPTSQTPFSEDQNEQTANIKL